jgi:hypothetical protein
MNPAPCRTEEYLMKRIRAEVQMTRHTSVDFQIDDHADDTKIRNAAVDESELAEWSDDAPTVLSYEVLKDSPNPESTHRTLEQIARRFLVDEELYPELNIPPETMKEVIFALLAHDHDRKMRREAEKIDPTTAKLLYPTRLEKHQEKLKKLLRLPDQKEPGLFDEPS